MRYIAAVNSADGNTYVIDTNPSGARGIVLAVAADAANADRIVTALNAQEGSA